MKKDVLRLRNMRFFAYHGVCPEENRLGQAFEVDLEILGDFAKAGLSDDLDDAVDYARVLALVEDVVVHRRFRLIEALAAAIAQGVGEALAPVELTVRVRKPHPPVATQFDGIEVELRRSYA